MAVSSKILTVTMRKKKLLKKNYKYFLKHKLSNIITVEIRYLEYLLSRTFSSIHSILSVTGLINSFGISSPAISNIYYIELFSRSLQHFLGVFSVCYLQCFHFIHSIISTWIKIKTSDFFVLKNKRTKLRDSD